MRVGSYLFIFFGSRRGQEGPAPHPGPPPQSGKREEYSLPLRRHGRFLQSLDFVANPGRGFVVFAGDGLLEIGP